MGERAVEDVGVKVEAAQQDRHWIVAAEEFFLDIAGGGGQALHLEPGELVLRHAYRPAQAGASWRLCVGVGSRGRVKIVQKKLGRDQLALSVCDRYHSLPVVDRRFKDGFKLQMGY